jgi:hypothetical protein
VELVQCGKGDVCGLELRYSVEEVRGRELKAALFTGLVEGSQ